MSIVADTPVVKSTKTTTSSVGDGDEFGISKFDTVCERDRISNLDLTGYLMVKIN